MFDVLDKDMFIDEVRARRGGDVAVRDHVEAAAPASISCDYQPNGHLHPSYMEWFNHNEDSYFR